MSHVSLEEYHDVSTVLYKQYLESEKPEMFVYFEEFNKYGLPRTKTILDKLEQKYEVIVIGSYAYDEGNGHDIYLDMSMNQIADHLGIKGQADSWDYIEEEILSYGIIIKPEFIEFYERLDAQMESQKQLLNPVSQMPIPKNKSESKIQYDKLNHVISYQSKTIKLSGWLEREVCKAVFANRKKVVNFYDVLENADRGKEPRSISDAAGRINEKMKKEFNLTSVIIIDTPSTTLRISENYR